MGTFYSRVVHPLNTFLSLGSWVGWAISASGLTGAVLIAWASTTWTWYWSTFSWAGVAIAFLIALLVFAGVALLLSLAFWPWQRPAGEKKPNDDLGQGDVVQPSNKSPASEMFGRPTLTQLPPALATGLYVSDIRFTFDDLEKNRRAELTMRVFNGTGRAVEFSSLSGRMTFKAPNSADPQHTGELPTPSLRYDVAKVVYPLQEWLFILEQHVPAQDADKLISMLQNDVPIHIELDGLAISVFAQDDPKKLERLPLWNGITLRRGISIGRIINVAVHVGAGWGP
jgi:hypothetical protein